MISSTCLGLFFSSLLFDMNSKLFCVTVLISCLNGIILNGTLKNKCLEFFPSLKRDDFDNCSWKSISFKKFEEQATWLKEQFLNENLSEKTKKKYKNVKLQKQEHVLLLVSPTNYRLLLPLTISIVKSCVQFVFLNPKETGITMYGQWIVGDNQLQCSTLVAEPLYHFIVYVLLKNALRVKMFFASILGGKSSSSKPKGEETKDIKIKKVFFIRYQEKEKYSYLLEIFNLVYCKLFADKVIDFSEFVPPKNILNEEIDGIDADEVIGYTNTTGTTGFIIFISKNQKYLILKTISFHLFRNSKSKCNFSRIFNIFF